MEEVGVALGETEDGVDRVVGELDALLGCRHFDGCSGVAGKSGELRQPSADENHGEVPLSPAMDRGDERPELDRGEVLHFVDGEECDQTSWTLCGFSMRSVKGHPELGAPTSLASSFGDRSSGGTRIRRCFIESPDHRTEVVGSLVATNTATVNGDDR